MAFCRAPNFSHKGARMQSLSSHSALVCAALLAATLPAQAVIVDVNVYGTVTVGSSTANPSFAGNTVQVGFSYDTATVGVAGVFSGGANFLNPFVVLNGVRYVTFHDEFPPTHPTTVTLVDGTPDSLAVDFAVSSYVAPVSRDESLKINFSAASDFLNGTTLLPSAASVAGTGSGSFNLLYINDCQNYACGPGIVFFAGATFSLNRLEIGVAAVPEPTSYGMWACGGAMLALAIRRRQKRS
jgi:hypothetical protein